MNTAPTSLNGRALAELPNFDLAARLHIAATVAARDGKLYLADLLAEAARRLDTLAEGRP